VQSVTMVVAARISAASVLWDAFAAVATMAFSFRATGQLSQCTWR
jgi:hypothetical protein